MRDLQEIAKGIDPVNVLENVIEEMKAIEQSRLRGPDPEWDNMGGGQLFKEMEIALKDGISEGIVRCLRCLGLNDSEIGELIECYPGRNIPAA